MLAIINTDTVLSSSDQIVSYIGLAAIMEADQ
jgi:hypothetical protein